MIYEVDPYPNLEIIVVDNASEDDLNPWIRQNHPEIRYYRLPKNLGFGRANNIGMKKANGKYLMILNSDVILIPGWLKSCVEVLEKRPDIGQVGTLTLEPKDKKKLNLKPFPRIRFVEFPMTNGAMFLTRKGLIAEDSVGLFDRYFFFFSEDMDLGSRCWLNGYKMVLITSHYIFHGRYLEDTKKITSERRIRIYTKSRLYYISKWVGFHRVFLEICYNLTYLVYAIFVKKDLVRIKGKINGIKDYFRDFGRIYQIGLMFRKRYPNAPKVWNNLYKLSIRPILNIYKNLIQDRETEEKMKYQPEDWGRRF
jgi:GT2 family glycosyltransferase